MLQEIWCGDSSVFPLMKIIFLGFYKRIPNCFPRRDDRGIKQSPEELLEQVFQSHLCLLIHGPWWPTSFLIVLLIT